MLRSGKVYGPGCQNLQTLCRTGAGKVQRACTADSSLGASLGLEPFSVAFVGHCGDTRCALLVRGSAFPSALPPSFFRPSFLRTKFLPGF